MNVTVDEPARRDKWFKSQLNAPGAYLIPWFRAAFARGASKISVRISQEEILCSDNGENLPSEPRTLLERLVTTPIADPSSSAYFTGLTDSFPEHALLLTPGPTEISLMDRANKWTLMPLSGNRFSEANMTPHSPRLRIRRPEIWAEVELKALSRYASGSLYPLSINGNPLEQCSFLPPCLLRYRVPGEGEFGLLLHGETPFLRWLNQGLEDASKADLQPTPPARSSLGIGGWAAAIEMSWFSSRGWEGVYAHIRQLLEYLPARFNTMTRTGQSRTRDLLLQALPCPHSPAIHHFPLWNDINVPGANSTLLSTEEVVNLPSPLTVTPSPGSPDLINPFAGPVIELDGSFWKTLRRLQIPSVRWTLPQSTRASWRTRLSRRWHLRARKRWVCPGPVTPQNLSRDNPWFILQEYLRSNSHEYRFLELLTLLPDLELALLPPGHTRPCLHAASGKLLLPDIPGPNPPKSGEDAMIMLLALLDHEL